MPDTPLFMGWTREDLRLFVIRALEMRGVEVNDALVEEQLLYIQVAWDNCAADSTALWLVGECLDQQGI